MRCRQRSRESTCRLLLEGECLARRNWEFPTLGEGAERAVSHSSCARPQATLKQEAQRDKPLRHTSPLAQNHLSQRRRGPRQVAYTAEGDGPR